MSGLISIREVERPTRFLSHSPAPSTASSHAQSGRLLFPPPQLLPLPSPKAPDTSDSGLRSLPRVETQSGCFPWGSLPACLLTECGRGSGMPCRVGGVALGSGHLGHVAGAARRPQSWQGSTPRHRALVRPLARRSGCGPGQGYKEASVDGDACRARSPPGPGGCLRSEGGGPGGTWEKAGGDTDLRFGCQLGQITSSPGPSISSPVNGIFLKKNTFY